MHCCLLMLLLLVTFQVSTPRAKSILCQLCALFLCNSIDVCYALVLVHSEVIDSSSRYDATSGHAAHRQGWTAIVYNIIYLSLSIYRGSHCLLYNDCVNALPLLCCLHTVGVAMAAGQLWSSASDVLFVLCCRMGIVQNSCETTHMKIVIRCC